MRNCLNTVPHFYIPIRYLLLYKNNNFNNNITIMSLFLKLFNTTAEYNAYTADTENFILPNVSCTLDDLTTVHYNPLPQPYSGFCKLTLQDESVVEIQGSGTLALTYEQIKQYYDTCIGIEIGTQCTAIGAKAFNYYYEDPMSGEIEEYYFENVTKVLISSGVTSIGDFAFQGCSSLTSVTIPNSVTSIGSGAFNDCSSLESITVDDNNTIYNSHNNCNAIIKTNTHELVCGCKNTVIPNDVTSIGSTAFYNCSGLTSIDIPSGVTSIGDSAFLNCDGLTSITIPSGVTSIGRNAFNRCSSLTSIICNATTPPTLGNYNVFYRTNNCPIYVPSGSVDSYKAATNWSDYASRIQAIP